ncbi:hypothetical protein HDU97_006437 [Phlyctochytrium planicorne]|nr:hypothetical protein HDU97_006437 [Phlyctochytrium planicorne]
MERILLLQRKTDDLTETISHLDVKVARLDNKRQEQKRKATGILEILQALSDEISYPCFSRRKNEPSKAQPVPVEICHVYPEKKETTQFVSSNEDLDDGGTSEAIKVQLTESDFVSSGVPVAETNKTSTRIVKAYLTFPKEYDANVIEGLVEEGNKQTQVSTTAHIPVELYMSHDEAEVVCDTLDENEVSSSPNASMPKPRKQKKLESKALTIPSPSSSNDEYPSPSKPISRNIFDPLTKDHCENLPPKVSRSKPTVAKIRLRIYKPELAFQTSSSRTRSHGETDGQA